mgnify:CR=1 FL=1
MNEKKISFNKLILLTMGALVLAMLLWRFSPGPEWMAKRTALRYAGQYAPEFSCYVRAMDAGQADHGFWIVSLFRAEDENQQGPALRLEVHSSVFPTEVTAADWWAVEETDWPDYELPVPG